MHVVTRKSFEIEVVESMLISLGARQRRYCLRDISAFSATEMHLHDIALYKFSILFYSILYRRIGCYADCGRLGVCGRESRRTRYELVRRRWACTDALHWLHDQTQGHLSVLRWSHASHQVHSKHSTTNSKEEEEEIYLAQNQQIKCKYKSYTIQLSRVTGKPEGQLCRPP